MEARVGIEPTNAAFAEPCLTTWLPRHRFQLIDASLQASDRCRPDLSGRRRPHRVQFRNQRDWRLTER